MKDLKGKVCLVTGAAGGVGLEISRLLLQNGCKVSLLDIDQELGEKVTTKLQETYGESHCRFLKCDVTNKAELEGCFDATRSFFGGLDVVVNNAGILPHPDSAKVFPVNVATVYNGTLLAFKHMGKDNGHKGGDVINVASMAGLYPMPDSPAYGASKHAVVGMTRNFGSDLHLNRHGVRVNCLCPSSVKTKMLDNLLENARKCKETLGLAELYEKMSIEPSLVAQGAIKVLEDDRNGAALVCAPKIGLKYHDFPQLPGL
ncbi:15-hydroxyprostaglandin dehydrogenase [NAD(+)]-like [Haemaphysalis longicornis]